MRSPGCMWLFSALFISVCIVRTNGQAPGPSPAPTFPTAAYLTLMTNDIIVNADLWDEEPKIFTANYAFEGITGVINGTEESYARAAGGAWNTVPSECTNTTTARTSVTTPMNVAYSWGYPTFYADAMPIVFSWPVLPSTVNNTDFLLTLNNGTKVNPAVASLVPNHETNERSTVVVFGEFGNRIDPSLPDAEYVVEVEIVDDGSPLMLVGPNGTLVSAVGMKYNASGSLPYGPSAVGPKLVAAKISMMSTEGEGTNGTATDNTFPNDCRALYGSEIQYRLRMYTSGGFSPDGVSSLTPDAYQTYFRVHVSAEDGSTVLLNDTGVDYEIPGAGKLKIHGLADLGLKNDTYNLCYASDHDNYIDVCMTGDLAAARLVSGIEIPVGNSTADPEGRYKGLYNPGGPGNDPTPGVNYTLPTSYQLQSVRQSLDDPFTTSYGTPLPPVAAPTSAPTSAPGPAPVSPSPSEPSPESYPSPNPVPVLSSASLMRSSIMAIVVATAATLL